MNKLSGFLMLGLGVVVVLASVFNWISLEGGGIDHFLDWPVTRQAMMIGGLVAAVLGLLVMRGGKDKK